ncbi:unnamed protein product [Clonostachys solani]|uniref:Uncharacterized protein n=1 Tax=Clonostachys solani TaxID=160281 RepID=A0A9P0EIR7_9HYPO|nr:unnamed protein product [Clonostachys solani]
MGARDDERRLLCLLNSRLTTRRRSCLSEIWMPSRKEEGWDQRQVGMRDESRAAQEIIDDALPNILQENTTLWQATLLIFGESPYNTFSRTNGMMYLTGSQVNVGDTSPIFTHASVERLLSIISHPFLYERSTSETLRLFLQFSVIAGIGARTGWTPPLASGKSDCPVLGSPNPILDSPILGSPILNELRKEMFLVSKNDHPIESIYERFIRLTKSHPESVEALILAKVGHFAHARARGSNQKIQERQKELYNQEGICAVSIHELIGICQALDEVASAKQEMSTERALRALKEAIPRWRPFPSQEVASIMKDVWRYESCLSYRSQQSQISAEETPQQRMDNIGTTPTPKGASGDFSEVHKPDQSNMAIECQITREVIAVDTDDVMNCCAAIDDAPRKSLAELWMEGIHLNCPSNMSK